MSDRVKHKDASEYRSKYQQVLQQRDFKKFEHRLVDVVQNNCPKKLAVLTSLLSESGVRLHEDLPETKMLLHTALLYNNDDLTVFKMLAEGFPELLLQVKLESQQNVLHIAVAKQNIDAVSYILEKMEKAFDNGVLLLQSFLHEKIHSTSDGVFDGTCMETELPLSIAAWNTDLPMVELLISRGARIDEVNRKKETVFHSLVKATASEEAKEDKSRVKNLVSMFHSLIKVACAGIDVRTGMQRLSMVLNTEDECGYTPLALTAKLPCGPMFDAIINCNVYKFLKSLDGMSMVYLYDVTDLDHAISKNRSVMSLITTHSYGQVEEYSYFTEQSPVLHMIRQKWQAYRKYYYIWGTLHLGMCMAPLVSIYHSQLDGYHIWPVSKPNYTSNATATHYFSGEEYAIGVYQVLFHLYAVIILLAEIRLLCLGCRDRNSRPQLTDVQNVVNPLSNGPFRILLIVFGCSAILSSVGLFVPMNSAQLTINSVNLISGWSFLLFFTRGFKSFSYFTVILLEAILKDLTRLSMMYLLIMIPFSGAMSLAFSDTENSQFSSFWLTSQSMFELAVGLSDRAEFENAKRPSVVRSIYFSYLVLTYLLLLNMLIALLSDTSIRISNNRQSQWHLQKLNIILYIERQLPLRLQKVCGRQKMSRLFVSHEDIASDAGTPRAVSPWLLPARTMDSSCKKATTTRYYLDIKVSSPPPHGHQQETDSKMVTDPESKTTSTSAAAKLHHHNSMIGTGMERTAEPHYDLV